MVDVPGRTDRDPEGREDEDLLAVLGDRARWVAVVGADVCDVLRVDRSEQAHHHDQDEQRAEEQRRLVAAQPPGRQPPGAGAGRDLLAGLGAEVGRRLLEPGGGRIMCVGNERHKRGGPGQSIRPGPRNAAFLPFALLQRERGPVPAVLGLEDQTRVVDAVRREERERLVPEHRDVRLLREVLVERLPL